MVRELSNFRVAFLTLCSLPPFGLLGCHRLSVGAHKQALMFVVTIGFLGIGWIADITQIIRNPHAWAKKVRMEEQRIQRLPSPNRCILLALAGCWLGIFGIHRNLIYHSFFPLQFLTIMWVRDVKKIYNSPSWWLHNGLIDLSANYPPFKALVDAMGVEASAKLAQTCAQFAYSSELSFQSLSRITWREDPDVGIIDLKNKTAPMYLLQQPTNQAELSISNSQWRKYYSSKENFAIDAYYEIKTRCDCWLCKASSNLFLWSISGKEKNSSGVSITLHPEDDLGELRANPAVMVHHPYMSTLKVNHNFFDVKHFCVEEDCETGWPKVTRTGDKVTIQINELIKAIMVEPIVD